MLDAVISCLRCPHCGGRLRCSDGVVRCGAAHAFDIARQGYLSLFGPSPPAGRGDTAAMVAARAAFLGAGHYEPLADAVAAACGPAGTSGCVVDVGAGTGYYLARVLEGREDAVGVALDVSRHAVRRAARAHPRIGAVACDAWSGLPVRTGAASAVLNVFAPRNGAEMRRVLRPDGTCVVVTPTPRHLGEVVGPLGLLTVDRQKPQRLHDQLAPVLSVVGRETLEVPLRLAHGAVVDLVAMGPTAWHADPATVVRRVARLPEPVAVTASFTVTVLRRAAGGTRPAG